MIKEYPFAKYLSILGQGRHGTRSLTREEAKKAMEMVLLGDVEDLQLGAFLTLLRVKEETSEELAGFLEALQSSLNFSEDLPQADLNWPTYAGKKRQLHWYLLSALLLAENGVKIFMHGTAGDDEGRIYAVHVLKKLGYGAASNIREAAHQIKNLNFTYLHIKHISPKLYDLLKLRPLFGLRLPTHTLARLLNPVNAPYSIQGIFHRGYQNLHQEAAIMVGQPYLAVIKGEGGEAERIPDKPCLVDMVKDGKICDEEWPEMHIKMQPMQEEMDINHLVDVWRGKKEDDYGSAAVIGTMAIVLYLMGKAPNRIEAEKIAEKMWKERKAASKEKSMA